jgi:tol-pal system protein YbgF
MTKIASLSRRLSLVAALIAPFALGACAMKSDVRNMQTDLNRMQQRQDSVLREIQLQNRLLLDSIRASIALTVDARGTSTAQMRQFEQNVNQLGQLVGQVMGSLNRIEQRIGALEQRPSGAVGAPASPGASASASGGGSAEEYYTTGMQMMSQQAYATARMAFEQLVREFPEHDRAPDAQFQLGQALYQEQQYDEAYRALEQVATQWPQAARAPAALFRAGAIAEERRDFARARTYYERVRRDFAGTDEARQAQQKLQSLPRR